MRRGGNVPRLSSSYFAVGSLLLAWSPHRAFGTQLLEGGILIESAGLDPLA